MQKKAQTRITYTVMCGKATRTDVNYLLLERRLIGETNMNILGLLIFLMGKRVSRRSPALSRIVSQVSVPKRTLFLDWVSC